MFLHWNTAQNYLNISSFSNSFLILRFENSQMGQDLLNRVNGLCTQTLNPSKHLVLLAIWASATSGKKKPHSQSFLCHSSFIRIVFNFNSLFFLNIIINMPSSSLKKKHSYNLSYWFSNFISAGGPECHLCMNCLLSES